MTVNSQKLRRHKAMRKGLGNTLLVIWPMLKMNLHEKAMLAVTTGAMNVNFVFWH